MTEFFKNIYQHNALKEADFQEIMAAHHQVKFSKNEIVLEENIVSNEYYLIEKGLFRSFVNDFNGNEITTNFFNENEILIEVPSLFLKVPSNENLQAITDSVCWKINFEDFQKLYSEILGFTEWGRSWMTNQLFIEKQRSVNMITKSATERYLNLISHQPAVIKEVPLKYIASYLGITDSSLSRIRKEIVQKT